MPFPWSHGRYETTQYEMHHLQPLLRNVRDSKGDRRQIIFHFGYHCFTDKVKSQDFRHPFVDANFPTENRVFCPKRWLLSRELTSMLDKDISTIKVEAATADQWVWNHAIDGINRPYCVFFRFGVAQPNLPLRIDVVSAYIRSGGRVGGGAKDRLIAILANVCGPSGALAPK